MGGHLTTTVIYRLLVRSYGDRDYPATLSSEELGQGNLSLAFRLHRTSKEWEDTLKAHSFFASGVGGDRVATSRQMWDPLTTDQKPSPHLSVRRTDSKPLAKESSTCVPKVLGIWIGATLNPPLVLDQLRSQPQPPQPRRDWLDWFSWF